MIGEILEAEFHSAFLHAFRIDARLAHAGHVAFDVCHEHGHSCLREALGHDFERDRFARARCAGDETMPVRLVEQQITGVVALGHPDFAVLKHEDLLTNGCNIGILPVVTR